MHTVRPGPPTGEEIDDELAIHPRSSSIAAQSQGHDPSRRLDRCCSGDGHRAVLAGGLVHHLEPAVVLLTAFPAGLPHQTAHRNRTVPRHRNSRVGHHCRQHGAGHETASSHRGRDEHRVRPEVPCLPRETSPRDHRHLLRGTGTDHCCDVRRPDHHCAGMVECDVVRGP